MRIYQKKFIIMWKVKETFFGGIDFTFRKKKENATNWKIIVEYLEEKHSEETVKFFYLLVANEAT